MRILLVEDEPHAAHMLAKGLRARSFAVDIATEGVTAVYLSSINSYDLIILDVMLPLKDGFEVCREIRSAEVSAPVLMLTALDDVRDRIVGLDSGADDYLVKPFDFHELLARVRALLRRGQLLQPETIEAGDLKINTRSHAVQRAGQLIALTAKEYALLEYLVRHADQVVSRSEIAEHVWDEGFDPFSNLIEVYIQRLRRKIDDGREPKLIRTLRGDGYLLTAGNDYLPA